jgi:hypothetical protein
MGPRRDEAFSRCLGGVGRKAKANKPLTVPKAGERMQPITIMGASLPAFRLW